LQANYSLGDLFREGKKYSVTRVLVFSAKPISKRPKAYAKRECLVEARAEAGGGAGLHLALLPSVLRGVDRDRDRDRHRGVGKGRVRHRVVGKGRVRHRVKEEEGSESNSREHHQNSNNNNNHMVQVTMTRRI
jgi:hypothetical protein